ncbi:MAG TPA: rhodanese-like domain-containing protein [Thermomicrobiales bacterium]|jgi:hydroxyacylglutathione hydrolase|nr:rhodanese-like domain-containing protein [Thermomicrobiales bacterium]
MIVDRVSTPGLAQVAYLVADEAAAQAAVIDPRRDIADYLAWAERHGVAIVAILETHVHADFVSGARELASATGAPIYASRLGATAFPHIPLDDGDTIPIGALTLRALWTPGHTPEHISYLLFDQTRGLDPIALFSGDVLFVGEIGRPDLLGPEAQQTLIEQLWETVSQRLAKLPDQVIVYPGHTAGSPCGKQIGAAPQTTIGRERAFNYAFQQPNQDAFVHAVMAGMPKPPAYYPFMKRVNKLGPELLATLPTGKPLRVADLAAERAADALVIDARPAADFAKDHIPGAISIELGPNFAIWAGWLTPYEREVVLVLDDDAHYDAALTELRRIGIDSVAGYLAGGMTVWAAAGKPTETMETIEARELAWRRGGYTVLDVRDRAEYESGHIAGALHAFAGDLAQGAAAPANGSDRVAVICGAGFRSMVASSLLQRRGKHDVVNVGGGMAAWTAAGLPTSRN